MPRPTLRTELQGAPLTLTLPPLSYALLRRLDCRRALADVRRPGPHPRPNSAIPGPIIAQALALSPQPPSSHPNPNPHLRCGATCSPRPRQGAVRSYVTSREPRGIGQVVLQPAPPEPIQPRRLPVSAAASATAFAHRRICFWLVSRIHRLLVLYIGEEFDAQWAQLYAELTGIGALTMTDTWQSYSKARGDATPLNSGRSSWGLAC